MDETAHGAGELQRTCRARTRRKPRNHGRDEWPVGSPVACRLATRHHALVSTGPTLALALVVLGSLFGCGDDASTGIDAALPDAGPRDAGPGADSDDRFPPPDAGPPADAGLAWPNAEHPATSDPWIAEHHDDLVVMRPRILALNFVNARTNEQMLAHLGELVDAIAEATRHRGYADADAQPFLQYEISHAIDLRDDPPPASWSLRNSTLYPREEPQEGAWSFDYEALFTESFASLMGIEDPADPGRALTLCELSERGLVHEVWVYGDADVPDVSAAEILAITRRWEYDGTRRDDLPLERCAANGCFDGEDEIPDTCQRTLRIGWVNNTRGVGCFLESLGHGYEGLARESTTPYFGRYFRELGGFDLGSRFGLPFDSWYACGYTGGGDCLSYASPTRVTWNVAGDTGTVDPYVAACGNAHFPPNGRNHYDIVNAAEVMSTCAGYRRGEAGGEDLAQPTSAADWDGYRDLAPDCTGAWAVYWWQSFPGLGNDAVDDDGAPMKNWWPFLFY